jgi:Rrf2 family protein
MFQLTTKTHYGIRALIDLAIAYDKNLVQIKELVEKHNIPKSYLEQIFNRLTKNGLIKSVRGKSGGYLLGVNPENITILEICEILEGPINILHEKGVGSLNSVFRDIEMCAKENLNISLQKLSEIERANSEKLMYYI